MRIHFKSDVFAAVAIVGAKVLLIKGLDITLVSEKIIPNIEENLRV